MRLGGGCQGCGAADVTLRQGIEEAILGAVPELKRVLDATDHAAGYEPLLRPFGDRQLSFGPGLNACMK